MVEQIKSNFKLWSQAIARTIENSIPGITAEFITYREKSLAFTYEGVCMALPVRVLKQLYDDGAAILDVTSVILDITEEKIGVLEDIDEIEDAGVFYQMIQHKLNICDSMDWVCDFFIPMKDVYVSLVEDKDEVMYECIWYKNEDQLIIDKY